MILPFLNLRRHLDELNKEITDAFEGVFKNGNFILGDYVAAFESEWARFCETSGAVSVANGTDALTLALLASGAVEPHRGDEVITTPLTAAYTSLAILNAGAKPVFADISEKNFNLDPEQIKQFITPRTKAIMPVHLYGQTADTEAINEIAKRHKLIVIEDASQAHAAKFDGKPAGSSTLAATFSFYPTKNLGAFGDGGAVVSNDENFLAKLRLLRQGGNAEAIKQNSAGRNSRLDEMQAAFLSVKLKYLTAWTERRRELARLYFGNLSDLPQLRLPEVRNFDEHVFHLFVIRHERRDELKKYLAERGIETIIHYPYLLHQQELFKSAGQQPLPVAEKIVTEILSLPLYPQMENTEIETVCAVIREFSKAETRA